MYPTSPQTTPELMTFYIVGYIFISLCTAVAIIDANDARNTNEWIASIIVGFLWPMIFTIRIIRKILN
jgi:hypothetical protein